MGQSSLGGFEGGFQKRIAIGGQHDFPWLEVERENAHMLLWDGKAVDHGIGLVLILHCFEHARDDGCPCSVVGQELVVGQGRLTDDGSSLFGQFLLVGLGVVVVLVAHKALAVAHHPYLAAQSAEDDARGSEAFFGMGRQLWKLRLAVVTGNGLGGHEAELVAGRVLGHSAQQLTDDVHGVAAIGAKETVALVGLAGGAIDHGDKVSGDDDSVLAFLRGGLGDEALLDDLHSVVACCEAHEAA